MLFLRFLPIWSNRTVIADEQGLRWRERRFGAEQYIMWSNVRSFSRISAALMSNLGAYGALLANQGVIYVLDSPDATLIWTLSPAASDSVYGASEYLCRLIASRTNLPLRDLTTIANDLAATRGNVQRIAAMRFSFGETAPVSPTLQALAQQPTPQQRLWPRVAPVFVASLIPLLLFVAIFGYGGFVQNYQQSYFASLPQRLRAETPIYQDSLAAPDGQWPVGAPTKQNVWGERYGNGGYQLYGTSADAFNAVWITEVGNITNAAYEVTVMEQGKIGANGDGIGIEFGNDLNNSKFGLFEVDSSGDWDLSAFHYDSSDPSNSWSYIDGGSSSAIHQGLGVENTLLLLKRGKAFLCYVNDQLVGTYYDRFNDLPSSGLPGIYIADDAQVGTFSNFAVYPVQAPSSLWYV